MIPHFFQHNTSMMPLALRMAAIILAVALGPLFPSRSVAEENAWNQAPTLGNPMEEHFSEPDTVIPGRQGRGPVRSRAAFTDSPVTAAPFLPKQGSRKENKQQEIVQTSVDADTEANPWEGTPVAAQAPTYWGNLASQTPSGNIAPTGNTVPSGESGLPSFQNQHLTTDPNRNASPLSPSVNNSLQATSPYYQNYAQNYAQAYGQTVPPGVYPNQNNGAYANPSMNPYAGMASGVPYGYPQPYYGAYGNPYAGGMYGAYGADPNLLNSYASIARQQQMLIARQQEMLEGTRNRPPRPASSTEKTGKPDGDDSEEEKSSWSMDDLMPLKISSPLASTLWSGAGYLSPFGPNDGPDKGVGMPLKMRSWTDRPYYFGGFVGYMGGSDLMSSTVVTANGTTNVKLKEDDGGNGGLTLGWNFHNYWGLEGRLHFASLSIKYRYDDPTIWAYEPDGTNQITICDVSVHYYPLGNSKWRPYLKYGLGVTGMNFMHFDGSSKSVTTVSMPIGFGLKYWWNERIALNLDLVDNIIFSADGVKTQYNFGISAGFSWSFGRNKNCRPTAYWPYTPSGRR